MTESMAQSAPLRQSYPVAVASVPWGSAPLSPFGGVPFGGVPLGGVALPATPPVPLTHSPAEPAESELQITDDDYGYGIAHVILPGCPHPFYSFLRQWTPAFVPSLEGALALALALALVFDSPMLRANVASFGGIYALFAIYLVGGALFGVALYFARSDAAWFVTLVMGGLLLPALILSPVLGAAYAVPMLIGALVIGLLFLGIHRTEIGEGRVAVTKLLGRYFRVVRLDHFLRLPGERVVALLDANERVFTTPTVYAELDSPDGTGYRARATCTATYAILPSEAHRVLPVLATWEHDLEQQVLRALHEALTEWATHATITGSPPPRGTLSRDVMSDVRHWAQRHGIWLMRMRVHNIWLQPLSDASWMPSGPLSASGALPPRSVSQSAFFPGSPAYPNVYPLPVSQPSSARPSSPSAGYTPRMSTPAAGSGAPSGAFSPASAPARPPVNPSRPAIAGWMAAAQTAADDEALRQAPGHAPGPRGVQSGATQAGAPSIPSASASPEALVAAYEEVREGRVTDPLTIREIAQAFRVAAEQPPADSFPYDGYAAAYVLEEYAAKLEH